jgi:hypothetical protein
VKVDEDALLMMLIEHRQGGATEELRAPSPSLSPPQRDRHATF